MATLAETFGILGWVCVPPRGVVSPPRPAPRLLLPMPTRDSGGWELLRAVANMLDTSFASKEPLLPLLMPLSVLLPAPCSVAMPDRGCSGPRESEPPPDMPANDGAIPSPATAESDGNPTTPAERVDAPPVEDTQGKSRPWGGAVEPLRSEAAAGRGGLGSPEPVSDGGNATIGRTFAAALVKSVDMGLEEIFMLPRFTGRLVSSSKSSSSSSLKSLKLGWDSMREELNPTETPLLIR